jgi:hypothetical protein
MFSDSWFCWVLFFKILQVLGICALEGFYLPAQQRLSK